MRKSSAKNPRESWNWRQHLTCGLALSGLLTLTAAAAGRVELELYTEPGLAAVEAQNWYRLLTDLKVDGCDIRSGAPEKIEVVTRGSAQQPVYLVRGYLTGRGELQFPGRKFTLQDRSRLRAWIEELRTWGPQGAPQGQPLFGLNAAQYGAVRKDLAQVVNFVTTGKERPAVVREIASGLQHPWNLSPRFLEALASEGKVVEEVQGITSGTALAYLLRPVGWNFRPERLPDGTLQYRAAPAGEFSEHWPIGWAPTDRRSKALPVLMEFLNVEIEPTPLLEILPVMKEHLKVPLLLDRNAAAQHQIDLQRKVSYPSKRSYYDNILGSLLGQAQLKSEVRLDEANRPFLWITTVKKAN